MPLIDFWVKTCDSHAAELPLVSSRLVERWWTSCEMHPGSLSSSSLAPPWGPCWQNNGHTLSGPTGSRPMVPETDRPTSAPPTTFLRDTTVCGGLLWLAVPLTPHLLMDKAEWLHRFGPPWPRCSSRRAERGRQRGRGSKRQQKKTLGGSVGKHSWGSNSGAFNGS